MSDATDIANIEALLREQGYTHVRDYMVSATSIHGILEGKGFIQFQNPDLNTANMTGWKFHLSVDHADLAAASRIAVEHFAEHNVGAFKIAASATASEFASEAQIGRQAGKMLTVYDSGNEDWQRIMSGLEEKFARANIRPGVVVSGDRPVAGSRYAHYRNDGTGEGRGAYASANDTQISESQRYNPTGAPDPFAELDLARPSPAIAAENALKLDAAERAARIGPWVNASRGNSQDMRLDVTDMPDAQRYSILNGMRNQGILAEPHRSDSIGRDFIRVRDPEGMELIRAAQVEHLPRHIQSMGQPQLVLNREGVYEYRINVDQMSAYNRSRAIDILNQAGIGVELYDGSRGTVLRTVNADSLVAMSSLAERFAQSPSMGTEQQQPRQQQQQMPQQQQQSSMSNSPEALAAREATRLEQFRIQSEMLAAATADADTAPDRRSADSVGAGLRGGATVDSSEVAAAGVEPSAINRRNPLGFDNFGRPLPALGNPVGLIQPSWAEGVERLPPLDMEGLQRDLRARAMGGDGNPPTELASFGRRGLASVAGEAGGVVANGNGQPLVQPQSPVQDGALRASLAVDAPADAPAPTVGNSEATVELRPTSQLRPAVADVANFSATAVLAANSNEVGANGRTAVADAGGRNAAARFMPAGLAAPAPANDVGAAVPAPAPAAPVEVHAAASVDAPTVVSRPAVTAAITAAAIASEGAALRTPTDTTHGNAGMNRSMAGVGLAMSVSQIQVIQEKLARGETVSNAEYAAAGLNVGYSTIDAVTAGTLDDTISRTLRLGRTGGPLVQAALAAPMIYSAAQTGDTTAIGAASFGAIGGIGAGVAGQALIPVPGVGFVVGVVVGDGAAKVGGLATTAIFNDDPAQRDAAKAELRVIGYEYFASPGAAVNLTGAVVSSIGRAATTLGEVGKWGGNYLEEMNEQAQAEVSRRLHPMAAVPINALLTVTNNMTAVPLKAAGTVLSAVGTGVDYVGQGAEAVGHGINRTAEEGVRVAGAVAQEGGRVVGRARQEFTRTFTRELEREPTVRGALRATAVATGEVVHRAGEYAERRFNQAVEAGSNALNRAGSWISSHTPTWLGGSAGRDHDDDHAPARRAPARPAPAAPARRGYTIAANVGDQLEAHGFKPSMDRNRDGQIDVNEIRATFRQHGLTAGQVDTNGDHVFSAREVSNAINAAVVRARGNGR